MHEQILLVDDDPDILHIYSLILERTGFIVTQAKDGEEALKRILEKYEKEESYDMLITDIQMPRMNGIDLIQRLQSYTIELPIIVISSMRNERWMQKLLKNGCLEFFVKPVNAQNLVKRIQTTFMHRKSLSSSND